MQEARRRLFASVSQTNCRAGHKSNRRAAKSIALGWSLRKAPARARKSGVSLAVCFEPNELMTRNTGAAIISVHKLPLFLASRWL